MKLRILKKHFDAAVKQDWDGGKCLVAQALESNNRNPIEACDADLWTDETAYELQSEFDSNFDFTGDEQKPELQNLRASLPFTVEIP